MERREMETYEAIMTRRSIPKMGEGIPSIDQLERLLHAAIMAPNHHLTEPWRFVVLGADELKLLGEVFAGVAEEAGGNSALARDLPQRAPIIITVIEHPRDDPHVPEIEEHHTVGAAMQNVLLAAHAEGLAAMIRTGPYARATEVRQHLGVAPSEIVAGFIYVGYPPDGFTKKVPRKTPVGELTEWRGVAHPAESPSAPLTTSEEGDR